MQSESVQCQGQAQETLAQGMNKPRVTPACTPLVPVAACS
jgi:hypothetical protein